MNSKTYIGVGKDREGMYFWWLTTATGHRLYNSELFPSKSACEQAIKVMKRELGSAPVMDISAYVPDKRKRLRLVA